MSLTWSFGTCRVHELRKRVLQRLSARHRLMPPELHGASSNDEKLPSHSPGGADRKPPAERRSAAASEW